MSSFSTSTKRSAAAPPHMGLALALLASFAASACTVRPLYQDVSSSIAPIAGEQAPAGLNSISIQPVDTRQGQVVRNHLIFALNGGAGEPAAPRYLLNLTVRSRIIGAARVQIARENEPTAGAAVMTVRYRLIDAQTGRQVLMGNRSATASFDKSRQIFASVRAEIDAENRAARELAEILRLTLAQDLIRLASG